MNTPIGDGDFTPERIKRRTLILCLNILRNYAYLNVCVQKNGKFYETIRNNFISVITLEWCKIFVDKKGKHYWEKSIEDRGNFITEMIGELGMCKEAYDRDVVLFKNFRDEAVAHLDKKNHITFPNLEITKHTTIYLYEYLMEGDESADNKNLMPDIRSYYDICAQEAFEALKCNVCVDQPASKY